MTGTCSEFFTLSGGCTRKHYLKLYCPHSRANIRAQYFFAIRVIGVLNRLRPHIVSADPVASFAKDINSLSAHILVPDFNYSDCSLFSFLLCAPISAFIALLSLHHSVSLCLVK